MTRAVQNRRRIDPILGLFPTLRETKYPRNSISPRLGGRAWVGGPTRPPERGCVPQSRDQPQHSRRSNPGGLVTQTVGLPSALLRLVWQTPPRSAGVRRGCPEMRPLARIPAVSSLGWFVIGAGLLLTGWCDNMHKTFNLMLCLPWKTSGR